MNHLAGSDLLLAARFLAMALSMTAAAVISTSLLGLSDPPSGMRLSAWGARWLAQTNDLVTRAAWKVEANLALCERVGRWPAFGLVGAVHHPELGASF